MSLKKWFNDLILLNVIRTRMKFVRCPKTKPSALVSKVYFEGLHQKTNAILEKYDLRI